MPLLFKNGKLVLNDIDQLVFSDDPNSCRCCPGLCECPSGSDYSVPKYVSDVSFTFSNVPDTYFGERNYDITVQYSNGVVDKYVSERRFEVSGISALNGTYPFSLDSISSPGTACTQPDPFPTCAYDANMDCQWVRSEPVVPITGIFRNYGYTRLSGVESTIEENYYITGWAKGNPGSTVANAALIEMQLCMREGSYTGDIKRTFVIQIRRILGQPGVNEVQTNLNNIIRTGCSEDFTVSVAPIPQATFPNSVLNSYEQRPYFLCSELLGNQIAINPYWCNNNANAASSFSLARCQATKSESATVPPPVFGGGLGYTQTSAWDYDLCGFDFDVAWNYTLTPP